MSENLGPSSQNTIGVASLNLYLNKTQSSYKPTHPRYLEPQYQRIDSLSQTLVDLPISLDIVMLQELHIQWWRNNGRRLANNLNLEKIWTFNHNSLRRKDEFLAVCGNKVDEAYAFEVGDDRKAVKAMVGSIAFAGVHNRSGVLNGHVRVENTGAVLHELRDHDKAVILGDTNANPGTKPRDMLTDAGFVPVFRLTGDTVSTTKLPITFPTEDYRDITLTQAQKLVVGRGYSLDTIEVRGFEPREVVQAGTVMTKKSDHKTLYSELAPETA